MVLPKQRAKVSRWDLHPSPLLQNTSSTILEGTGGIGAGGTVVVVGGVPDDAVTLVGEAVVVEAAVVVGEAVVVEAAVVVWAAVVVEAAVVVWSAVVVEAAVVVWSAVVVSCECTALQIMQSAIRTMKDFISKISRITFNDYGIALSLIYISPVIKRAEFIFVTQIQAQRRTSIYIYI